MVFNLFAIARDTITNRHISISVAKWLNSSCDIAFLNLDFLSFIIILKKNCAYCNILAYKLFKTGTKHIVIFFTEI